MKEESEKKRKTMRKKKTTKSETRRETIRASQTIFCEAFLGKGTMLLPSFSWDLKQPCQFNSTVSSQSRRHSLRALRRNTAGDFYEDQQVKLLFPHKDELLKKLELLCHEMMEMKFSFQQASTTAGTSLRVWDLLILEHPSAPAAFSQWNIPPPWQPAFPIEKE
ncbi:uncharacterized protein ACOB8E_001501 isoform 2-T2 [Sarcophilus harrisii]